MKRTLEDKDGGQPKRRKKQALEGEGNFQPLKYSHLLNVAELNEGILLTCTPRHEVKCLKELLPILDKLYEQYITEPIPNPSTTQFSKFFDVIDTLVLGVCVIRLRVVVGTFDSLSFIKYVFNQVAQNPEISAWVKLCQRMVPIQFLCDGSNLDRVLKNSDLPDFLVKLFSDTGKTEEKQATEEVEKKEGELEKPKTYSLIFRGRNNESTGIHRDPLYHGIIPYIPDQFKIDWKNPDRILLIENFKSVCSFTLVSSKDHEHYKKFNIRIFTTNEKEK